MKRETPEKKNSLAVLIEAPGDLYQGGLPLVDSDSTAVGTVRLSRQTTVTRGATTELRNPGQGQRRVMNRVRSPQRR